MSMSVKEAVPWLKRYQGYAPTPEPDEDGKPVCCVHGFDLTWPPSTWSKTRPTITGSWTRPPECPLWRVNQN